MNLAMNPEPGWAWLGSLLTTVFFFTFLAWTWWAFAPSRRAQHEAAGRIPFDEEDSQ